MVSVRYCHHGAPLHFDVRSRPGHVTANRRPAQDDGSDALRASEQRYRTAINAGFDAFLYVVPVRDAAGAIAALRIADANERAAQLAGKPLDAIVGETLTTVFPHTATTGLSAQCCQVIETGESAEFTQALSLPDLGDRWVERRLLPLEGGVAISSRDVTARHKERLALEASEARHRELFESNVAVQLVVDAATGAIVDANPAAEQFYGWPRAALSSMLITDLETVTLAEWQAQAAPASRASGAHPRREHIVASGERRQVESFQGLVQVDGRRLAHLIVQDVSERVRAEQRLHESETRFRAVVNGMRDGVVLYDANGRARMMNPGARRLLSLTAQAESVHDATGEAFIRTEWSAIHDDGTPWPATEHPALVALHSNTSQPVTLMGIANADGTHRWVRVCADPLVREGDTMPYAAVMLLADVTDVHAAEERLREAQKLEAVGQLAGGIAHDFNNALTVIRGATGFLRDSVQGPTAEEDIATIERATDKAENLTRQLLAFARRQPLQLESVDFNALLREYGATVRETLPASIHVAFELTTDSAFAHADRRRALDAVRLLVDNARTAMPHGGSLTLGTRRVMRSVSRAAARRSKLPGVERPFVELFVRDSGEGIDEATRAALFEPFSATQPFGAGRGMGLPAVHGMMAQSGGGIECVSEPGAGTEFRLRFPALADEVEK